jgi:hypothetical protein
LEACAPELPWAGMGGTLCAQFGSAAASAFLAGLQCIWVEPALPLSFDDCANAGAAIKPAAITAVRIFIARISLSLNQLRIKRGLLPVISPSAEYS